MYNEFFNWTWTTLGKYLNRYFAFQVRRRCLVGHLCILGLSNCQYTMLDGRPICIPAHPPLALGRVPVQVLQGGWSPFHPLFIRGSYQTGRISRCSVDFYHLPKNFYLNLMPLLPKTKSYLKQYFYLIFHDMTTNLCFVTCCI